MGSSNGHPLNPLKTTVAMGYHHFFVGMVIWCGAVAMAKINILAFCMDCILIMILFFTARSIMILEEESHDFVFNDCSDLVDNCM